MPKVGDNIFLAYASYSEVILGLHEEQGNGSLH